MVLQRDLFVLGFLLRLGLDRVFPFMFVFSLDGS